MRYAGALVLCAAICAAMTGCRSAEDDVRDTMARVESAAVHGDRDTLFLLHRDSVDGGPFCAATFARAWRSAGQASPDACEHARAVRNTPAAGSEEARLLALTIDFRCSHPEGTCQDLAKAAFLDGTGAGPGDMTALEVNRVELRDDGGTAAVHATIYRPSSAKTRAVFTLERVGDRWLLTSAPF